MATTADRSDSDNAASMVARSTGDLAAIIAAARSEGEREASDKNPAPWQQQPQRLAGGLKIMHLSFLFESKHRFQVIPDRTPLGQRD